jgi:hypothetical protein
MSQHPQRDRLDALFTPLTSLAQKHGGPTPITDELKFLGRAMGFKLKNWNCRTFTVQREPQEM